MMQHSSLPIEHLKPQIETKYKVHLFFSPARSIKIKKGGSGVTTFLAVCVLWYKNNILAWFLIDQNNYVDQMEVTKALVYDLPFNHEQ